MIDFIPTEAFLDAYPPEIREPAERLREIVRLAVPDSIERVRSGWRLIGYEVRIGRRTAVFAYVAPEPNHVHLGFHWGIAMADPGRRLEGAHLHLRRVRFLTFRPGDDLPVDALIALTLEAARVAVLPSDERALAIRTS
jgi:hypothetical protein